MGRTLLNSRGRFADSVIRVSKSSSRLSPGKAPLYAERDRWILYEAVQNHFFREERKKVRQTMQDCGNHTECIVVFNGDDCPLCIAEKILKTLEQEIEKSRAILNEFRRAAGEIGLKFN